MRILDLSTEYCGRYGTRLLADYGHEVIAVELSKRGVSLDAATLTADLAVLKLHLERNKLRSTADLSDPATIPALLALMGSVDAIVHTFPPAVANRLGLGLDAIRAVAPTAILMTLTPFGYAGEGADRPATEKTLQAAGGMMLLSGGYQGVERGDPPLGLNLPVVATITGIYGAMCLLAADIGADVDGRAFRHLDIAARDLLPANLEKLTASLTYLKVVNFRGTRGRSPSAGSGNMLAKDGYFHVFVLRDAFRTLAQLIGREDLANDPAWSDRKKRTYTPEQTGKIAAEAILQETLAELGARAEKLKIPSGPVVEIDKLAERAQLQHRGAFDVTALGLEINEPYRFAETPRLKNGLRPVSALADLVGKQPGQPKAVPTSSGDGRGPLKGVRVLDLTQAYAGPSATRILGELGAEVLKIESVGRLDIYPRTLLPFDNDTTGDFWERSAYFAERNLNKKGLTLDLSDPACRDIFARLVQHADVVASNFTPRVMPAWGFGPEQLLKINPKLVVLAMSGFGATGPDKDMPALAGLIEATSGFTSQVRYDDDSPPVDVGFSFGDMVSGLYAALSTVMALDARRRTGRGDAIDLSCAEAPLPILAPQLTQWARDGRRPSVAQEVVPGGRHVFVHCKDHAESWVIAFEPDEHHGKVAGLFGVQKPPSQSHLISVDLTQRDVVSYLRTADILCAPLLDAEQIQFDPELLDRKVFDVVERLDVGPLPHARTVTPLINGQPLGVALAPPPRLGEHTEAVLGELLGVTRAQIEALEAAGLSGRAPLEPIASVRRVPLPLDEIEAAGRLRRPANVRQRLAAAFGYEATARNSASLEPIVE